MSDDLSMWAESNPAPGSVPFYEGDRSVSVQMTELPSKIMERIEEHHDTIIDLRIEARGPGDRNFKSASGKLIVDPDNRPSVDAMGQQLMKLAERHAKTVDDPEEYCYRTAIRYDSPGGDIKWIRREFTVKIVNGAPVFDDSVVDDRERTDLKLFRFFFEQQRNENDELRRFIMKREEEYAKRIDKLVDAVCRSAHELPAIATSVGEVAKSSATTLHEASLLWKESEQKSTATRKMELEAELARADQAAQQQKWDVAMQLGSVAVPMLISKAMGIPPEGAMMLVQMMQGANQGGAGGVMDALGGMGGPQQPQMPAQAPAMAMPGAPAPRAVPAPQKAKPQKGPDPMTADIPSGDDWTPPELPELAFSGGTENDPEPNGYDEHLLLWFHMLEKHQEQKVRALVGPDVYDAIRFSSGKDNSTAVQALRGLKRKIDTLDLSTKMTLTRQLLAVLGNIHASTLWNLLNAAAVDPSVPD